MTIIVIPTPNYNLRAGWQKPLYIILHYTGMETSEAAVERLCSPHSNVSAHFTINEDGEIYQHLDVEKRAWHAGKAYWRGETDINSYSIGIELVNPGHEHGYRPFPKSQIQAMTPLIKDLMDDHNIPPENVLGHSDIAPLRKQDPGELFPWATLANLGIGVWPEPTAADIETAAQWSLDDYVVAVRRYGYDPWGGYESVLRAYERHFAPELLLGSSDDEQLGRMRLACLLRLYGVKKKA